MSRQGALLIRTDAGAEIGAGHFMRSLALAQAWRDAGGEICFMMSGAEPFRSRLDREAMSLAVSRAESGSREDALKTVREAREYGASWITVDGYRFGPGYQREIKEAGLKLLAIDDHGHAGSYVADVVLDQNLDADEGLYAARSPETRLLLGTKYALIGREFLRRAPEAKTMAETARKILVTLGGSDPVNATGKIVEAIDRIGREDWDVTVLAGAANPHRRSLAERVTRVRCPIKVVYDAKDMAEWMAWADVAVCAAGGTSWEMCFMGVPFLVTAVAENQVRNAKTLAAHGAAVNLSPPKDAVFSECLEETLARIVESRSVREAMSARGRELVDGQGAWRVVACLTEDLELREATAGDCRLVWEWANDQETRRVSFRTEPIPWDSHVEWYRSKLADSRCRLYIAMNGAKSPVGQVRYDLEGDEAAISVSVDRRYRGLGYGGRLIRLGCDKLFETSPVRAVRAYVKEENEVSKRAFLAAGFLPEGSEQIRGSWVTRFSLARATVS
jgi:UDP-2,4-diacetamido-2,4,6-trideoxy-beta-L-altropyranose hydrolase